MWVNVLGKDDSFWCHQVIIGVCNLNVERCCIWYCLCLFLYVSDTMIWREKEWFRVNTV